MDTVDFIPFNDEYEIVPMGVNCDIAHYLRVNSLRRFALPFDWAVTPIKSAIELLENGFDEFLSKANLIYLPPVHRMLFKENGIELAITEEMITPVVCRRYKMLFPHDFSINGKADFPVIHAKYVKRIRRLADILSSDKVIFFVRQDGQLNDWQESQYVLALGAGFENYSVGDQWKTDLSGILRKKYKKLKFKLLEFKELKDLFNLKEEDRPDKPSVITRFMSRLRSLRLGKREMLG